MLQVRCLFLPFAQVRVASTRLEGEQRRGCGSHGDDDGGKSGGAGDAMAPIAGETWPNGHNGVCGEKDNMWYYQKWQTHTKLNMYCLKCVSLFCVCDFCLSFLLVVFFWVPHPAGVCGKQNTPLVQAFALPSSSRSSYPLPDSGLR